MPRRGSPLVWREYGPGRKRGYPCRWGCGQSLLTESARTVHEETCSERPEPAQPDN